MADAVRILRFPAETSRHLERPAENARMGTKVMGDSAEDTALVTAILALHLHLALITTGSFRASVVMGIPETVSDLMAAKLTGQDRTRSTAISTAEMAFVSSKTLTQFASATLAGLESTATNEEILASQTHAFTTPSAKQSTAELISNAHARMTGRVKFATFQQDNAAGFSKNNPGRLTFLRELITTHRILSAFGASWSMVVTEFR